MDFQINDFRQALGGFGPVAAQRRAMSQGMGRQLVASAIGINIGSTMPARRASIVGREQAGMEFQTRVLMAADGRKVSVAYAGEQPAAVASVALRGTQPTASYEAGFHA